MIETYQNIYQLGSIYTTAGGIIISFAFALWRWSKCISKYIETGNIDSPEGTLFFGANNWFYGETHRGLEYGMNPWMIALDIVFMSMASVILALIWPISTIVLSVIAYAKIARVRFAKKKEFMDRLAGESN